MEVGMDGAMWLWMQLAMTKVVLVMQESKDPADACEHISLNEFASIFQKYVAIGTVRSNTTAIWPGSKPWTKFCQNRYTFLAMLI
jgi:hypothetical protein